MEKKWSKGQWKLSLFEDGAFTLWNRGTNKDMVICQRNQVPDDMIDEGVANAHLIAAAPELYEACEDALLLLEKMRMATSATSLKLYRTLAKARGETGERGE